MNNPVDEIQRRTVRYRYIDGLDELAFGAICLVMGLYFFAQATLPHKSTLYKVLDVGFVLVLLTTGLITFRIVKAFKERLTYPRTGFVAYREERGSRRWVGALVAMVMGGALAALFAGAPKSFAWMPSSTGFIIAAAMLAIGFKLGLTRFYLLAGASLAAGLLLSASGVKDVIGLAYYYMLFALALMVSGGLTLWQYLRTYPSSEAAE